MTSTTTAPPRPLLEVVGVSKSFPGVRALDHAELRVRPGEVHALVGENGAGKSTLMRVLGGIYRPDEGEMLLDGAPYAPAGPAEAQAAGISLIHQELNLVPDLTVAQNIFLGREPRGSRTRLLAERRAVERAGRILASIGVDIDPRTPVSRLAIANQQMVEIAKAISFDARVLVMDEPTAALTGHEVERLFGLIRRFVTASTAVIYISHRMAEIREITQRITVMRDGRFVDEQATAGTSTRETIRLMVGREIADDLRPSTKHVADRTALEVRGVSTAALLRDVSFVLRPGEVLGFAGLVGAGRSELARAIVGADPRTAGEVLVGGEVRDIRTPADAVRAGIGYLSEDRKRDGLVLDDTVRRNISLASLPAFRGRSGLIRDARISAVADRYVRTLRIKTPGLDQVVRNLSGGNQQKVVLAKWLARNCDILIFDEPTRGIDVGTKQEIYTLLESLADNGSAIMVISSEMEEVLRLSDRVVVMCNGAVSGELTREAASAESIMELATAFKRDAA
ncbi:MAG TPA: sugar ABC transporter ATP-binding protein [Cellulomonas sp.]